MQLERLFLGARSVHERAETGHVSGVGVPEEEQCEVHVRDLFESQRKSLAPEACLHLHQCHGRGGREIGCYEQSNRAVHGGAGESQADEATPLTTQSGYLTHVSENARNAVLFSILPRLVGNGRPAAFFPLMITSAALAGMNSDAMP